MISVSNPRFHSISNDYSHVRYVHKGLEISWYFSKVIFKVPKNGNHFRFSMAAAEGDW